MPEHQTAGPLTLQVLSGLVGFRAGDCTEEAGAGQVIVLEPAIGHEIEALEESACLLTLASA
jgi:quercetin dioxygenase-like cupin family protein